LDDPCINTKLNEDEISVQEVGVHPPERVQSEVGKCFPTHTRAYFHKRDVIIISCNIFFAVLQGKRAVIRTYFQEIVESIDSIADGNILDHIIAKLLPVITTTRAHLDPQIQQPLQKPADFDLAFKFAPAQKNETQLRFEKVKSKSNKPKFPLTLVT
jgi:hypothetical protein